MNAINLKEKLSLINDHWSPGVIAALNDCQFKLAKFAGDFIWHSHDDTDEAFFVVAGQFTMEFRDRSVEVREGELIVVPKGVEHRPRATTECQVLLVELAGTVNTGNAGGEKTVSADNWI